MKRAESTGQAALEKGSIKSLSPLFSYLKPYRMAVIAATIALLFTSGAVLAMGAALKYLIDAGIASGDASLLDTYFWRLLVVVGLLALATYARYFLVSWIGESVVADIRSDIFRKVISMHLAFFETTRTGDILSRITTDTTLLQTVVGSSVSLFLRNSLLFVGGLSMLVITSFELTEYVLLLLPVVVAPILIIGKKVRALSRLTQEKVADISVQAEETIGAIRTIQTMAMEKVQAGLFEQVVRTARFAALKRIRTRALLTGIVIFLVFGAVVTVLWVGGKQVVAGEMSAGELSSFIFYAVVVAGSIGAISEVIGELQRAAGAMERLMELKALTPAIHSPRVATSLSLPARGDIRFDAVSFSYPSRLDAEALSACSFHVASGELVAIVGASGAGKTTLFQLLLRFYDPQVGSISLDDVPVPEWPIEALRQQFGVVPQDIAIFSANVWDNIRCGREASDAEVREAARLANALEFIDVLPQGFDTYLGEKGVRISGGQKQRIAIARALLKNPRILLLDEATSALDTENEMLIHQAMENAMQGRTTLVIAHRLSTILHADKIVVLSNGKIDAIGTHDSLMKQHGMYQRLVEMQFKQSA